MNGVIHKVIEIEHEDERRSLSILFNNTKLDSHQKFHPNQIKIINIKKDSVLGNHYHDYSEFFYCIVGEADYTFIDIITKEREEIKLRPGELIIINDGIAHKAHMKEGTVMIEGTEFPYMSSLINDHKYEVI